MMTEGTQDSDKSISRRTVLIAGGASVGAAALIGGAFWAGTTIGGGSTPTSNPTQDSGGTSDAGREPEILRSSNGKLTVDLVVAYTTVNIAGQDARLMTYNGTTPGPTLMAKPGDVITVNFTNNLGMMTNLHTHGLHVSPSGNSDNIFVHVEDGETFTYQYTLAEDHPSGVFWYHPHPHGMTADQLFSGLYGALIVEEPTPLPATQERVLVLSDISIRTDGSVAGANNMSKMMGREGDILLTNGQVQPGYASEQNALERWRIVNACASRYMTLSFTGAQQAQLLGIDSGHYAKPKNITTITLAPGNRADVMVQFGSAPVQLEYTAAPNTIMEGISITNYPVAVFTPTTTKAATVAPVAAIGAGPDLRGETINGTRSFTLNMPGGMGSGGMGGGMNGNFTINGEAFNMDVINTTVQLGHIEEWTLINATTMEHPFHLHVWPMQVLSIGGTAIDDVEYQDVVNIPANSQSVVRVHFDQFDGKAVYHCHILDHEDLGMMGIIQANV